MRTKLILAALAVIAATTSTGPASAQTAALGFGVGEIRQADISRFPQWMGAVARFSAERAAIGQPCQAAAGGCALQDWARTVESLRGYDRWTQIQEVNRLMNATRYTPDSSRYGAGDYWATPSQFYGMAGDCEDYAIAKFLALRLLGFSNDELRIAVVQDTSTNQIHSVLLVNEGGQTLVLDNLVSQVVSGSAATRYVPFYAINEQAWWLYSAPRGTQLAAAAVSRQPGS